MIKALSMEFYKIRHRKIGLTVLVIVMVQFIIASYSINKMKSYELEQGWMYLILLFSEINCFFMPITVAVISSRLSDIEHKGNTFKLLNAVMPASQLFVGKFLCGAVYIGIINIFQVGFMILSGNLKGFTEEFSIDYFFYYILITFIVNLTLLLLQLIISLIFSNQIISFVVAITGTLLGAFSMLIGSIAKFVPWGYYCELAPVRMNWDKDTRIIDLYWTNIPYGEVIALLIIFILLYTFGKQLFVRKEI
ncbi:ABC transporter permease [Clostridium saccharobutylicum]|uniref:ABC-2 family transporter protein n=2 Tax=Clostridium saccharobutylicum TaxID=169679 RepID=U5MQM8_CLOSA|nr:ABC transporter permease [Clostridium saccharobutylicum]AGX43104.1 ABC-2 family transporter protein [Clostridium saccharobutylicum DSM 13864]AQR90401.1 ABC-2 family transporter protein [Clostridium saccharobutylicum]AQS00307.1 ABC-2 family transporter protein [Clostridium saccharobutylicum]AQS14290.1 ABC-2 family transporter protein [Clostridium saccharobutylicum]MBA2907029.1 hypothetical protein [Clostridium saccharobutylicum]